MQFHEIDWVAWQPNLHATLLFVRRADQVLLMRKKRGIGAGKINAPGGKVDPGEAPLEAAVREVFEELGVTPLAPRQLGRVRFQVTDGLAMLIHVFVAHAHAGEARESDEGVPLWTPVDRIPYAEMWEDDPLWYPHMLAGTPFEMRTLFDRAERMLGHELILLDAPPG